MGPQVDRRPAINATSTSAFIFILNLRGQNLVATAEVKLTSRLPALRRSIRIVAGRIPHLFQILLNLRRNAGKVIELLVGNPAEMLLAEKKLFRIELGVVHRDG